MQLLTERLYVFRNSSESHHVEDRFSQERVGPGDLVIVPAGAKHNVSTISSIS